MTNAPNAPRPHPTPLTEEQVRAAWVVEPPVLDGPIDLAEYDPQWPALFRREKERIQRALGDRMLQLEHVGSTSVPGLAAKPIIDMCLVVADPSDEAAYVRPLEAAGYVLRIREPEWFEHRLFKGPDTSTCRITPTPRPMWSKRSSPAPEPASSSPRRVRGTRARGIARSRSGNRASCLRSERRRTTSRVPRP